MFNQGDSDEMAVAEELQSREEDEPTLYPDAAGLLQSQPVAGML